MCKQIISSQGKPCLISARLGMLRHIRSSLCEYNDLIKTLGLSMTKNNSQTQRRSLLNPQKHARAATSKVSMAQNRARAMISIVRCHYYEEYLVLMSSWVDIVFR